MFEKDMRLALLLDDYGELLSEQRRAIMELYYCEDLSLTEIAENTGITRQAVRDSIKKGEAELHRLEDALHLTKRLADIREKCADAAAQIEILLEDIADETHKTSLARLAEDLRTIVN